MRDSRAAWGAEEKAESPWGKKVVRLFLWATIKINPNKEVFNEML
jgi:hypothetical protein